MKDHLSEPLIIAVAKNLCYGENKEMAEKWWPHLPYSLQTDYLKRALDIVELVEANKKPKMRWRNS